MYKWIEPKICLENITGAEPLPPSGEREPCPPCNPGFYNNDTATCSPCPSGTYSDGMKRTENVLIYSLVLAAIYFFSYMCFCFLIVFFSLFLLQRVRSVRLGPSPFWVMSINGGISFPQTWRPPASMWATPNATVWMVGVFVCLAPSRSFFLFLHSFQHWYCSLICAINMKLKPVDGCIIFRETKIRNIPAKPDLNRSLMNPIYTQMFVSGVSASFLTTTPQPKSKIRYCLISPTFGKLPWL